MDTESRGVGSGTSARLAAVLAVLLLAGCSEGGAGENEPTPSGVSDLPRGDEAVSLDPDELSASIDNPFFPLEPGTRWVYQETDEDGAELRVVVTATTETRQIANGVTARVVRDTVTEDGELIEDTFDWYAQDAAGTVWYLGEETAEFEDGRLTTREGSFEAGVDGALAGVIMPAAPEVGQAYRQEYLAGEAEDNGEVLALGQMADVPAGHFDDLLLTADTSALEPDVLEYKLHAAGVGTVLTLGVSGGAGREELVRVSRVSEAQAGAAGTVPLGQPYD